MQFVSNSMAKALYNENFVSSISSGTVAKNDSFGSIYANKAEEVDPRAEIQYSDAETKAQRAKNNALNKIKDYDVMSVMRVSTKAPEAVKIAWIEASREVGWNGLGKTSDHGFRGLLAGQLGCNHSNSVDGTENILGDSIESAIAVIRTAKYQRENPSQGDWTADPSEWEKEKNFYNAFLDKLEKLCTGEINYDGKTVFGEFITQNPIEPLGESKSVFGLGTGELSRRIIDMTKRTDIDGVEYEMSAAYSAESTPQAPILEVKLKYGGKEKLYKVNINDVDMKSGSQVEQFALIAYAGDSEGIVHRYPAKGANVPNVLFKPNMARMLSLYGLSQIPWETQYGSDESIFELYHRSRNAGMGLKTNAADFTVRDEKIADDKPLWHWRDGILGFNAEVYKSAGSESQYTVKLRYDDGREDERIVDIDKLSADDCNIIDLHVKMYLLQDDGKITDEDSMMNLTLAHLYMDHRLPGATADTTVDFKSWYEQQLELETRNGGNFKNISRLLALLGYL